MSSLLRLLPIIAFVVSGVRAQMGCVAGAICTIQHPRDYNTGYAQQFSPTVSGTATTPVSSPPPSNAVRYWFPFGDSYTTTGFDPSGHLALPTVGNPLGNPPFPGFTGGGGENFVGFDTITYNKSTILTYNYAYVCTKPLSENHRLAGAETGLLRTYAYGGATINGTLVAPYLPTVLSLIDQVHEFLAGAGTKPVTSPWTSANSLFTVWIGINDLGNSFSEPGDRSAFSDLLLEEYFTQVQELVRRLQAFRVSTSRLFSPSLKIVANSAVGGKNFLFINVPPMERTPLMIAGQNATGLALLKSVILTYNSKLATKVVSFKANNTGVKTWLWDAHTEFNTILDNPTQYGFVDAVSFGNTGDFWGNNYHPSSPAHQIFAQQISALMAGTPWF
ncbi:hypothetical protein B0H16DRAFT_1720846 [Mycena metata]|uniref:Carbohydrate esterase family 16 protein n=1 Tax=Mycena metata TaxID=1033252 RepID=A0AAD7J768_9AGAR|nr:hypothetical protein B0H16DRAFT_1720846 [Mycena metata]